MVVTAFGLAIVGCARGDSSASMDSSLARDIALANANAAEPELNDTAVSPAATESAARAQSPRPQPPTSTGQPPATNETVKAGTTVEAPAPVAPRFHGIPSGTAFSLTTKSPVCTTNLPGDKITATVAADVVGENGAVIPAGSTVVLEVAQVTPGDKPENASVTMRMRSVIVNDQPVAVPSDVAITSDLERHTMPRDKGADRRKVIGGVVAGAIVGQIMGKNTKSTVTGAVVGGAAGAAAAAATGTKYDACLPAGGTVRVTTREPVPLTTTQ